MVHLHTRSCYSLLESPFRIEEIIDTAIEQGCTHVACTDLNSMYATMMFWKMAQAKGIHPILGLELACTYQEAPLHFVLLAKDDIALQELYGISTQLMNGEALAFASLVNQSQHCIVLTAGSSDQLEACMEHQDQAGIEALLQVCKEAWSDFYVSIAMNDSMLRKENNVLLKTCAKHLAIPTVALSRVYYKKREDVQKLRVLKAIAKQTSYQDKTLDVVNDRYFRSEQEMKELYDVEDLERAEAIAKQCNVQMSFKKSTLPTFENNLHIDNETYLIKLCKAGLEKRLNHQENLVYKKRLEYELSVIIKMGFTNYFLIVWDFIRFSRQQGIYVGPGRGSAVGSLAAYCLGITHIDPIKNHLLFERFLNPSRATMPDIDTDIPDDRREEVIAYVRNKYGKEKVAHIVTFTTLKAKQAIRDVGRILDFAPRKIDAMTKALGNGNVTLSQAIQNNRTFSRLVNETKDTQLLFTMASWIEGLPRHTSLHAAGIVLSNQEITKICPLVGIDESIEATQFTMEYLEELGLIKMDFLGIRNLTIIDSIVQSIERDTKEHLELLKLPLDDVKTYELLSKADTMGIFQLESDGIRKLLRQIQPKCFADIAAVLALYRPGPMQNIPLYLERRKHPETITYLDPRLEPILKETYGIMIYQEQIMQIATTIGGFSLAQADFLRKAMSKKKQDVMMEYRQAFIEGAVRNHCRRKVAEEIFASMERFAEYGFNKCHSYGYGLIVYQMAYLKANYPLHFYQSILNGVIGSENKTCQYVYECQRKRIPIYAPSIQYSQAEYGIEKEGLRMPFRTMKGIGPVVQKEIEAERNKELFKDFIDFVVRMSAHKVNESNMRILINGGALDELGLNRATMNENLGHVLQYAGIVQTKTEDGVLFDFDLVSRPNLIKMKENSLDKASKEKATYGFYLSEHPVQALRKHYPKAMPLQQTLAVMGNLEVLGQVIRYHVHKTKTQQTMCFLTIEDETGTLDIAIMPKLYEKERQQIKSQALVRIVGKKNREDSMIANRIDWLSDHLE